MEKRIVILAILIICVHLTCADITTVQCCTCNSMMPIGVNTQPQVYPSPFKIKIDPNELEYSARGTDINVNLTSDDPSRSFRQFMIQARRLDSKSDQAIGSFKVLDDNIDAISQCTYGGDIRSASTDNKPKRRVRLAWQPPSTPKGHLEFRASFVEDEKTFWVKERSRALFDKANKTRPPEPPRQYVAPPISPVNVDDCGNLKGCYRVPEGCIEEDCKYLFTWQDLPHSNTQESKMRFEMSAAVDGFHNRYFAVGLSEDTYMGSDFVFECVHNHSTNNVGGDVMVQQSLNLATDNKNVRMSRQLGIDFQEGSYSDGRIRCRFTRKISVNDEEYDSYPLTATPYHILMARGPLREGGVGRHGMEVGHLPAVSPDPVVFPSLDDISGRASYPMIKAHACLMLLAFMFFAPIGILWMKYYTTMWPNSRLFGERYWFVVHYNCAFWVVLLVIIAFILIFFEVGGYSKLPELPLKAHPILGIIIFVCTILIPVIILLRCLCRCVCGKDQCFRPLGNWFYFLCWAIAFCLAIPNIFIGLDMGKANVPWWLTWIVCLFYLFHLICEILLEIHQCCTQRRNEERRKKYELQKKENPNIHIPEPWPSGRNFKKNVLFVHFIVCIICTLIAVITVAVC